MALSEKRANFVREYVKDFNGTQAAIRAGYAKRGAKQTASRLLTHVDVQSAVMEASKRVQEIAEVDAAWVLKRLSLLVDVRISDLFTETGELRSPAEFPDGAQFLVSGIDVDEITEWDPVTKERRVIGHTKKVRLESRAKILEMLGKHTDVGAWLERIQVEENTSLAERLQRGRDRLRVVNGGRDDE